MAPTAQEEETREEALQSAAGSNREQSRDSSSYRLILTSTLLVGGASCINILVGIVRTKAMALLLGPEGFGLFALFNSIITMSQTVAGMGVNSSGVRQIAAANGSDDQSKIANTATVLRRVSVLLGLLGAGGVVLFSKQIAAATFGTTDKSPSVVVLSIAVFFTLVAGGQAALVQGMRRTGDFARISVFGALGGTCGSIVLVYLQRDAGIVPSLIAVAISTAAASWWYSRKVKINKPKLSLSFLFSETGDLLKLGLALMSSNLITMGVAYVVRITILHQLGVSATGLYQSAWTLGGLYVGLILQAMGADFYPRLTASADCNRTANQLVNEQTEMGLLLAGPGVLATLVFSPLVILLFYSSKFMSAVDILRWVCLGTLMQAVTWPIGFILIAKARRSLFMVCELMWSIVSLVLAYSLIAKFGLRGAGIAFFGSYIFHGGLIYAVVHRVSGFEWSAQNRRMASVFFCFISVTFLSFHILSLIAAEIFGCSMVVLSTLYSLRRLSTIVSFDRLPKPLQRLLNLLRPIISSGSKGDV